MDNYFVTSDAEQDLYTIRDYTMSKWGTKQSDKYLSELRDTFRLIAVNTNIGTCRLDIGESVYSFPHASHVLYYTTDNDFVVFFAVLHRSMIPEKHILERKR